MFLSANPVDPGQLTDHSSLATCPNYLMVAGANQDLTINLSGVRHMTV